MRFQQLDLLAFGPFSDVTLDLSGGDYGLHFVCGPNEAGKSSMLRAITAALYGIPRQSSDNFLHEYRSLRIGVRLQNAAGAELSFVRRKGRSDTLINPNHPQGAAFPDQVLDPFLCGIEGETFERVYGIDHAELLRGGAEMQSLKGLVGESLFAASLGGVGLAEFVSRLEDDAKRLFGKRNSSIKVGKNAFTDAMKAKRTAEVSSTQWEKMQRELQQARDQHQLLIHQLGEHRAQESKLERLRSSLRWVSERRRLLGELAELGDIFVLPEAYSSAERAQCQTELTQVHTRITSLTEELDGDLGVRARMSKICVPQAVIEHEAVIVPLQERLGAHLKAMSDLSTNVQVRRDELRAQAEGLLRDLGGDSSWNELDALRISPDRRVAIQNLGSDEKRLRSLPKELARQRGDLERALQIHQTDLEQIGDVQDTSQLARLVGQVSKLGDLTQDIADRRKSLNESETEAARRLATLGLWKGDLTSLVHTPLPSTDTVDRFDREFTSLDEQRKRFEQAKAERSQELSEVNDALLALERAGRPPSESELSQLRFHREQGWDLVRRAWLDGIQDDVAIREFSAGNSLAEAYERSVADADSVADRLRREADRVAQRAERESRRGQLHRRLAELSDEIDRRQESEKVLSSEWRDLWATAAISVPLPPREMRGWLERCASLTQLASEIDRSKRELQQAEDQHAEYCQQLVNRLAEVNETPRGTDDLDLLLEQAQEEIDREQGTQRRRDGLVRELASAERERQRLLDEERQAVAALKHWQEKWSHEMLSIGCPEDAVAEQANERINHLEELFKRIDQVAGLDARIQAIQQDADDFENVVSGLVERVAPDLSDLPAVESASQLRSRLDQARRDKVRLEGLLDDEDKAQRELDKASERCLEVKAQLGQLCRLARVVSDEELADVERSSSEVTTRRNRLSEIDDQLLELGGGLSIDELVAETQDRDADELAAALAEVKDKISALECERDRVVAQVRDLENACRAMDGNAEAAEADERALNILASIHASAERYLQLRLAANLLRNQIDRYRAENQDPLLDRASEFFGRLTCGEFAGLRTEYNDEDLPIIVGVRRRKNEVVHVEGMSTGTRDQLYLSLRLGYLDRQLSSREPMPFVVDDILVQYDDDRALAALKVLSELSQKTQVLFFTHHSRLLELAESNVSADSLFVHRLDGPTVPMDQPQPVPSAGRKPR